MVTVKIFWSKNELEEYLNDSIREGEYWTKDMDFLSRCILTNSHCGADAHREASVANLSDNSAACKPHCEQKEVA